MNSRWLRLLFGREFPLADVYCLWDALFADDRSLGAVEYVCVSMLLFIREECKQYLYRRMYIC
jgi:TBC1 domain family protein 5